MLLAPVIAIVVKTAAGAVIKEIIKEAVKKA